MSTYTFDTDVPNVQPSASSWELLSNTRVFQSPLTNAIQTASRKGSAWRVSLRFDDLFGEDRANMQAFLTKLDGQQHRFKIYDHAFTRRGTGTATGWESNTSSGNSLVLQKTSGTALTVKKGDYISVDNQLFMAVSDASTTSPHTAITITVAPEIRSMATGQAVELVEPTGTFILTSSASWDTQVGQVSSFTIEGIEDVLA